MTDNPTPLIEARDVSKYFGHVVALEDISMGVRAGEVMCLLGDNGAGKSTLIKIFSGVHHPDKGAMLIEGEETVFDSPRDAIDRGIATVYQDLAMIPLMGISRNFFIGREPTKGAGPFKRFDVKKADRITHEELGKIGIGLRDTAQPVATLSGGERQSVAIARAVYFGAKVLILDEHRALVVLVDAGEDLDQGGLPGPVVAEKAHDLTGADTHGDVLQRDDLPEVLGDIPDLDQRG